MLKYKIFISLTDACQWTQWNFKQLILRHKLLNSLRCDDMKQTHCTDELQNKYETKTYPQIWLVKCSFFISPLFKITKTHFKQMTKKQEKRATERFLHANLWHKQNATFQICLQMELKPIHCINIHECVCKCILFLFSLHSLSLSLR